MFNSIIVKEIRDSQSGKAYKVGDWVLVRKKSGSVFIGQIEEIFGDSFLICPDGFDKLIRFADIEKMRLADPAENLDFNF